MSERRHCRWCGKAIDYDRGNYSRTIYCSNRCNHQAAWHRRARIKRAARKPRDLVCVVCGEHYTVESSHGRPRATCSEPCRLAHIREVHLASDARRMASASDDSLTKWERQRRAEAALRSGPCELIDCTECRYQLKSGACAKYIVAKYRPLTLDEIGEEEGLTRERIRQIEARALEKIRLAAPHLADYLEALAEEPEWQRRPRRMERWRASELPYLSTPASGRRSAA